MNDINKRIDVNLSSLLSLKAEILRKQEEVNQAKVKQSVETFIPKKSRDSDSKTKIDIQQDIPSKDESNRMEYEDSVMLEKSKRVLESKSRYYEKMVAMGGKLNSDDNCLVMFNHKKQASDTNQIHSKVEFSTDDSSSDELYPKTADAKVEYTDCLGRTRSCLKQDLDFFIKKDTKLAAIIQPRELNQNEPMWMIDAKGSSDPVGHEKFDDGVSDICSSIISKHDQMKLNWEKKEQENVFKENVHYQDVLFDEARQHGVGYYAFSTDDAERAKQRTEFDETRAKTLASQKETETQKDRRDRITRERVLAAKNRQRARLGLTPLEDGPEKSGIEANKVSEEDEKFKKRSEKIEKRRDKEEKLRQEKRNKHIRPWDKNKSCVGACQKNNDSSSSDSNDCEKIWQYKPEREPMSQEQWNEKERMKRDPQFAPPSVQQIRPFHSVAPPQECFDSEIDISKESQGSLFFSTKRSESSTQFKKNNYDKAYKNPFKNNSGDLLQKSTFSDRKNVGVEIAPPPTFEYFGLNTTKRPKVEIKPHLEESIEAGLKYLRNQSDKGMLPTKSHWSAKADY